MRVAVPWWHLSPSPGHVEADVVVIGAGICGLSVALALVRRGRRPVVLERGGCGGGASGRNAGFLMRGAADCYAAAVRHWGRDLARRLWRFSEENLAGLLDAGLEALPSFRRIPSCLLAFDQDQLRELEQSAAWLRDDGFEVGWMARGDDSVWQHGRPLGGLINPHDAAVNPVDLIRWLRARLSAPVYEHCPVAAITPAEDGVRVAVRTPHLVFVTPHVLLCVNAYLPLLCPHLSWLVRPVRGQMLALTHESLRLDYSYYANRGYDYFRQTPDGTVVVGGRRHLFAEVETGYDEHPTEPVQSALEDFAAAVLGVPRAQMRIVARWAGTMGFTPDGLPIVAPVPGPWPGGSVWFCGGFTGHGMSLAHRTARAAVDAMLDGVASPFPLDRPQLACSRPVPSDAPSEPRDARASLRDAPTPRHVS